MNAKRLTQCMTFAVGLLVAQIGMAQAPAGAPAGATGLCKDGTYYTGANKQGACRGHQGVKDWYGAPSNQKAAPASSATSTPASASTAAPATQPHPLQPRRSLLQPQRPKRLRRPRQQVEALTRFG